LSITKNRAAAISTDRIGKVSKVVDPNMRECLVCEQLFTRQASAGHAKLACYPAKRATQGKRKLLAIAITAGIMDK
jgi:hypothetical protein